MHRHRHHPRVLRALRVEAVELVLAALQPLARGVVLDHHHRDVVELDRVGHRDQRPGLGADLVGLVVVHPVGDVLDALGPQVVERLPRLGEPGAEPAPGLPAGELLDQLHRLPDGRALIRQQVHRPLDEAVTHELPAGLEHRAGDRLVGFHHVGIDGGGGADLPPGQRLQQPPEADPHPVVVPGPVGDVRHHGHALRRGQVLAGHRLLDVPLLDVDDGPHRDAGALGEGPLRAGGEGRVVEAIAG